MDLENAMLSEISQSEKDKYHMIYLIYMESIEKTELTRKRGTNTDGEQAESCWGEVWGWRD